MLHAQILDPENTLADYTRRIRQLFVEADLLQSNLLQGKILRIPLQVHMFGGNSVCPTIVNDKPSIAKYLPNARVEE